MTKKKTRQIYCLLIRRLRKEGLAIINEGLILDLFNAPTDLVEYCLEILKNDYAKRNKLPRKIK